MIATWKFAKVLGWELNLDTAREWARDIINSYTIFEERAKDQIVLELISHKALETLAEYLLDDNKYELPAEYPASIVKTSGTKAQKTARR